MSNKNEDILQKLAPSIVEIISDDKEDSAILGTGFVVTDDGLVVTCRHVIADSEDKLMNSVKVRFHSDSSTDLKYTASPVREDQNFRDDPFIDIAFLKLDKLPEKGATSVKLDDKVVSLNHFASIGFKKAKEFKWLSAKGAIGIPTEIKSSKGYPSPEAIELHSSQIEPGMSGAPVLDIERDRVVGIISQRYKEEYNPAISNMAFALPVQSMIELYPKLREKNQGLILLSKFLNAIGEESSKIYRWIDEVYVPPNEYDEIKAALITDRIVFITGTKEFGKTFTAVRLMYEFFKKEGYKPRWVHERKEQSGPEGSDPQELVKITNEQDYIKPHQIVYFEDPFGKTRYESYTDLENYIRSIIDSIREVRDAYVIITSREEVFKEFEKDQLSEVELRNFEKKMNLKRTSYDIGSRKKILLNWAMISNCRWLHDIALKDQVLEAIEYEESLPTPLNIKDFVKASYNIKDGNQLEGLMKQISQETSKRFADEIIRMEEDEKILFLAFAYVGNGDLDIDLIKTIYERIVSAWKESNQNYYMDFDTVRKWFEGDKINISLTEITSKYEIAFSHPSYREAFQYAIGSEKRYNDRISSARIRDLFVEVLLKLASEDEAAEGVAYAIASNFEKLPYNIQQALFKLAHNHKAASGIARAISDNFDKLPSYISEQLLIKLAHNHKAASGIARATSDNFDKLPAYIREQLLLKLADYPEAAADVAEAITHNFDKLPPNIQQLLFKLADKGKAADVSDAIANNFDKLPPNVREQLLLTLSDKGKKAANGVGRSIKHNFDKLPPNVREQLLLTLSDKGKGGTWEVAEAITHNFNNLPPHVQQLLFKLADNDKAAGQVASEIVSNFNNLPPHIQQLLFKLADNDKAAGYLPSEIVSNFNNLPPHIQQLLFKLAENDETAGDVADAIANNFDKLPPNVREQLLLTLSDKGKKAAGDVAEAVSANFNNLPPHIQQLLFKLAENDETAGDVAEAITHNFDKLPPNIHQLLLELADRDSVAGTDLIVTVGYYYGYKLPDDIRKEILAKLKKKTPHEETPWA